MRHQTTTAALVALCVFPALVGAETYQLSIAPNLDVVRVRVMADGPIAAVVARSRAQALAIGQVVPCDALSTQALPLTSQRTRISDGSLRCLDYVAKLSDARGLRPAQQNDAWRITDPRDWLLRVDESAADATVDVRLPPDMQISTPWQPMRGSERRFHLQRGDVSGTPYVAFGRFRTVRVPVRDGTLRVAYFGAEADTSLMRLTTWLASAMHNIESRFDALVVAEPQVMLFETRSRAGDSPVPFGLVTRTFGPAVRFWVDSRRSVAELNADWTATHEFSHLLLPRVRDRWIGEGFASYLQNLLMASGGAYSDERAWQMLHAGFGRGAAALPNVAPAESSRRRGGLMKMYWAGAALALMADVEIRMRTENAVSLPDVFARYTWRQTPENVPISARELLTALDAEAGSPVLMPLYERYAGRPGFPDVAPLLERLGVTVIGDRVVFDDTAELAPLRKTLWRRPLSPQTLPPES
ncbi:MAG: hypothetical protein AAFX44_01085 [Pseudomonadota bacterium]